MSKKFTTPTKHNKGGKQGKRGTSERKSSFSRNIKCCRRQPSGVNAMSQFATPELSLASQGTLSNSPVTSNPLLSIYAPTFPELPSPESFLVLLLEPLLEKRIPD